MIARPEMCPVKLERRPLAAVLLAVAATAVLLTVSTSGTPAERLESSPTPATQAVPEPEPPQFTLVPAAGTQGVAPTGATWVATASGTLTDVRMVNEDGLSIAGTTSSDGTAWKPAEPLGYGRTYTLTATARGTDATTATRTTRFSTVVPRNQIDVELMTTSGARLRDGQALGAGTVIVARFDSTVSDRVAAESRMLVTTSPPVEGAWNWISDQKAHWRPREYFPPNTTVSVAANLYGAPLGDGAYGERDAGVDFTIGPSHVTIADDATKQVSVYENGNLVRTMPTSMGRGGSETVGGRTIAFWTQPGVYTVMDKANPVLMDSSTYGLPIDSPSGYKISVPYATRISPDGIYLHEREATVWAQGNTNVSAGCLNLSAENAAWFYEFSRPGDVVEIRNTGGQPLEQWQNGDWTIPWPQWRQGSAARG